jgi:hypothetical protein
MDCLCCRIQASPVEAVSLMISEATEAVSLSNPRVTYGSIFVDYF